MDRIKKVSVVGAGAIGTMFGGLIKYRHPEVDVVLITRGDHYLRMHDRGHAELRGDWGTCSVEVTASTDPQDSAGSDLVLFTVKTQNTEASVQPYKDLLGDAIVVSLQNGINQRLLARYVRNDRLLVGMTATNMAMLEPGVVSLQRNGVSVIGPPLPDVPPEIVERGRQTLAMSGLKFETSDHILGVQYNKLLMNTMGYASVVSASDFIREGILDRRWPKQVALPLLAEGLSVLDAADISLERTSGISDVIRFRRLLHALNAPGVDRVIQAFITHVLRPDRIVYSLYQDLCRRRPTEIDFVNGEIVRLAEDCGLQAPCNAAIVEMVHDIEGSPQLTFPSKDEVIDRIGGVTG